MSAENGGRGKPPVPPEGHGPPQERMEVAIAKEIIQPSMLTTARKDGDVLFVSVVIIEEGKAIQYTYTVEENGQKQLLDALTGGIHMPGTADISKVAQDKP